MQAEGSGSLSEQVNLLLRMSLLIVLEAFVHVLIAPAEHAIDQDREPDTSPLFHSRWLSSKSLDRRSTGHRGIDRPVGNLSEFEDPYVITDFLT